MLKRVKEILIGFILMASVILIMIFGTICKENTFNKKEVKNHDTVVDYIYDKYYANTDIKKEAYEFKTYWKNNELMYVTEHHTEGGWHYMAIFDKDLKLVNGEGKSSTNYNDLLEDINKLIEGL